MAKRRTAEANLSDLEHEHVERSIPLVINAQNIQKAIAKLEQELNSIYQVVVHGAAGDRRRPLPDMSVSKMCDDNVGV